MNNWTLDVFTISVLYSLIPILKDYNQRCDRRGLNLVGQLHLSLNPRVYILNLGSTLLPIVELDLISPGQTQWSHFEAYGLFKSSMFKGSVNNTRSNNHEMSTRSGAKIKKINQKTLSSS